MPTRGDQPGVSIKKVGGSQILFYILKQGKSGLTKVCKKKPTDWPARNKWAGWRKHPNLADC